MITKIKILKGFEDAHDEERSGKLKSYHLDAFQVGQELYIDSNLVVVIGDNGSGKSTFLNKLRGQEMDIMFGNTKNPYFELTYRGKSHYIPLQYDEEKQPIDFGGYAKFIFRTPGIEYTPEENLLKKCSSGQYSIYQIEKFLEKAQQSNPEQPLIFDQPEDGISIFRKQALVDLISKYAFEGNLQIFVATHEPRFLEVERAKIINLEDKPAQVYDGGKFDINPYLKSVKSLKDGLF